MPDGNWGLEMSNYFPKTVGLWLKFSSSHSAACVLAATFYCYSRSAPYFITRYIASNLQDNFSDFKWKLLKSLFPSSLKLYHLLCWSASITETSWVKQKQQWQMERRDKCVIFSKMAQFQSVYLFTYNPYYSWIPYFKIHLFAKMYLTLSILSHFPCTESWKMCCPVWTLSAEVW